ncbi:hypothetical protein FRC10_000545 [Ceratobasidium sp. 414]|nr:hypothetical protein FRC10_000545 [Ceratobasidium sp. 414]
MTWWDPNKKMEGEVLERLVGIYGVGQHMWHSDVFKVCNCGSTLDDSCGGCLDRTPNQDRVLVMKNLTDLDIDIPEEKEGEEETQYSKSGDASQAELLVLTSFAKAVEVGEYSEAYAHRASRVYRRLLMSTVGSPLCSAESSRQLLEAVRDAILGNSVLMLREEHGYKKREWKVPRAVVGELDPGLAESERLLDDLGQDPTGMLNDFNLFTTHSEVDAAFFSDSSPEDAESRTDEPKSKRQKLSSGAVTSTPFSRSNKGKERNENKLEESSLESCCWRRQEGMSARRLSYSEW